MLHRKVAFFMHDKEKLVIANGYYITGKFSYVRSLSCDRRLLASLCASVRMYRRATA
jgi:hypothetical protein